MLCVIVLARIQTFCERTNFKKVATKIHRDEGTEIKKYANEASVFGPLSYPV